MEYHIEVVPEKDKFQVAFDVDPLFPDQAGDNIFNGNRVCA